MNVGRENNFFAVVSMVGRPRFRQARVPLAHGLVKAARSTRVRTQEEPARRGSRAPDLFTRKKKKKTKKNKGRRRREASSELLRFFKKMYTENSYENDATRTKITNSDT